MMLRQAQTSEPRALPRFAPVRLRTASRANPPFVRNLPPHVRANARFYWENPHQYGGAASSGSVAGNDPVNGRDPSGLLTACVEDDTGSYCYGDSGFDSGDGSDLFGGEFVNTDAINQAIANALTRSNNITIAQILGSRQPQKQKPFTCADALNQPGKIKASGVFGTITGLIGWTASRGTWTNLQTEAHGSFTTFGFTAGLAAGASYGSQTYTSMGAFTGMSDGYTVGASGGAGPVSVGGSYSSSWNDSGSGSGWNVDVGSAGLPFLGGAASYTETQISNCSAGR